MYHAIVRRRVVALFAAVSKGDARPVLDGLAPRLTARSVISNASP